MTDNEMHDETPSHWLRPFIDPLCYFQRIMIQTMNFNNKHFNQASTSNDPHSLDDIYRIFSDLTFEFESNTSSANDSSASSGNDPNESNGSNEPNESNESNTSNTSSSKFINDENEEKDEEIDDIDDDVELQELQSLQFMKSSHDLHLFLELINVSNHQEIIVFVQSLFEQYSINQLDFICCHQFGHKLIISLFKKCYTHNFKQSYQAILYKLIIPNIMKVSNLDYFYQCTRQILREIDDESLLVGFLTMIEKESEDRVFNLLSNRNFCSLFELLLNKGIPYRYIEFFAEPLRTDYAFYATLFPATLVLQQLVKIYPYAFLQVLPAHFSIDSFLYSLCLHKFGNYAISAFIENIVTFRAEFISKLFVPLVHMNKFAELSCNKYASNVIEKCIEYSTKRQFHCLISNLIEEKPRRCISKLIHSGYGHYVLKSVVGNARLFSLHSHSDRLLNNAYYVYSCLSQQSQEKLEIRCQWIINAIRHIN